MPSASCVLCRREISEDVSRLVETTDEFERPQSAPPLFADGISGGFALVRASSRNHEGGMNLCTALSCI